MKESIQNLIKIYKGMLPSLRGKARYVLENVIEDLEIALKR
jgi:hypothetical protein